MRPPAAFVQHPAFVLPSSHVMNSAPPLRNAAELRMAGTWLRSQVSPVAMEQSCMSLHMLGVIQT